MPKYCLESSTQYRKIDVFTCGIIRIIVIAFISSTGRRYPILLLKFCQIVSICYFLSLDPNTNIKINFIVKSDVSFFNFFYQHIFFKHI